MSSHTYRSFALVTGAAAAAFFGGCANRVVDTPVAERPVADVKAVESQQPASTNVEPQDLVSLTDQMARNILAIREIADAEQTPRVVLEPVVNETRFPINKDVFLTRIRTQLNARVAGRVRFLGRENLRALEREQQLKQEGLGTTSPDLAVAPFRGADYFLTGKLQSVSERTSDGMEDALVYEFQLIDATTSEIVWADSAEIKRRGLEDAAYR